MGENNAWGMDDSRELRRFPHGEGCSECRAKKWYLENGFRYCQNGHRIQSWVEYDAAEEDARGLGQVTRRRTGQSSQFDDLNAKQRLAGSAARTLFHECLQIILRKQVRWMIEEKQHPPALEAAVKDLWDIRLRSCAHDTTLLREVGDVQLHSSQDETELHDSLDIEGRLSTWDSTLKAGWRGPRAIDTISICYLGCFLLRLPTTVADVTMWANRGEMPYRRAVFTDHHLYYQLSF
ncbi:hypothetical protein jhhlp_003468 [Lomentospora prolificans]|uniref:Uncharacterized protein n=1 Tax=Lomentospora prolificans TaxID=41688 RepID=A0A2N3N8X8_9PEZI|nr:hypothetical protein jhhlp_003468 [Lomentospora prolificans]